MFDEFVVGFFLIECIELIEILFGLFVYMGFIIIEYDMDVVFCVVEFVMMMYNGCIFKEGSLVEIEDDLEV